MSENTDTTTKPAKQTYEAGTWQSTLDKSASLFERSGKARKQASVLLWQGAQAVTEEWLTSSDDDVQAEGLYSQVLDVLGTDRKGDASKIKSVALAVRNNGLVMSVYPNLSKAYAEAVRLTKTVQTQAAEDTAADEAVQDIVANAPKSSSTPEGAALIVLSKGVDEAARLLLDALGAQNTAAHRALLRAISQEISGRIQPAPKPAKQSTPKPAQPKSSAAKAKPAGDGAAKAKPAGDGAAKAKPAAGGKAKPAAAKPVTKAKPVTATPVEPEVEPDVEDMFADETEQAAPAPAPASTGKAKPVRRGPVRRG